jgi:glycosyltransferase involved in cell wall biosynthesis
LSGTTLVLLGARDDIASLLAAADVVVMPSRWEGWPLVAQEALRAGKALIASRVGGLPRLAGDAVEWVPADDPGALAVALRRLLADDVRRGALEAAARRRALELPDEAATMAALLAVYREVRR